MGRVRFTPSARRVEVADGRPFLRPERQRALLETLIQAFLGLDTELIPAEAILKGKPWTQNKHDTNLRNSLDTDFRRLRLKLEKHGGIRLAELFARERDGFIRVTTIDCEENAEASPTPPDPKSVDPSVEQLSEPKQPVAEPESFKSEPSQTQQQGICPVEKIAGAGGALAVVPQPVTLVTVKSRRNLIQVLMLGAGILLFTYSASLWVHQTWLSAAPGQLSIGLLKSKASPDFSEMLRSQLKQALEDQKGTAPRITVQLLDGTLDDVPRADQQKHAESLARWRPVNLVIGLAPATDGGFRPLVHVVKVIPNEQNSGLFPLAALKRLELVFPQGSDANKAVDAVADMASVLLGSHYALNDDTERSRLTLDGMKNKGAAALTYLLSRHHTGEKNEPADLSKVKADYDYVLERYPSLDQDSLNVVLALTAYQYGRIVNERDQDLSPADEALLAAHLENSVMAARELRKLDNRYFLSLAHVSVGQLALALCWHGQPKHRLKAGETAIEMFELARASNTGAEAYPDGLIQGLDPNYLLSMSHFAMVMAIQASSPESPGQLEIHRANAVKGIQETLKPCSNPPSIVPIDYPLVKYWNSCSLTHSAWASLQHAYGMLMLSAFESGANVSVEGAIGRLQRARDQYASLKRTEDEVRVLRSLAYAQRLKCRPSGGLACVDYLRQALSFAKEASSMLAIIRGQSPQKPLVDTLIESLERDLRDATMAP
jgi:hypothetical protein